jgi:hypothetical protein
MNLREGSARIVKLPDSQILKSVVPLSLVVALAALARTWQLSQNDFGRQYYAAGVLSMLRIWRNFIFNAFDPAGFVSIDKPPVAIWLQVASAKLFGFGALSILLAQVMAGLAGPPGLRSGAEILGWDGRGYRRAVARAQPNQCAIDRSNNTESCLILVLLAAVWLGTRAAETGRLTTFCAAMAAIGIGFNVKMGTALVLAPVLALTFSLARPGAPSPGISDDKPSRASSWLPSRCHGRSSSISRRPRIGPMRAVPGTTRCWSLHWCIMARPASLRCPRPQPTRQPRKCGSL